MTSSRQSDFKTLSENIEFIAATKLIKNGAKEAIDYFNWGRDLRHREVNTEKMPVAIAENTGDNSRTLLKNKIKQLIISYFKKIALKKWMLWEYKKNYKKFDETYQLMTDQSSRNLFAELLVMQMVGEQKLSLSSFTPDFVESYEKASSAILKAAESIQIYSWVIKKITLENPILSFYTSPTFLNLHYTERLYRYANAKTTIEVEGGDIVIDAGVGWGDTTVYLASKAAQKKDGHVYSFDILEEGLAALEKQIELNPNIRQNLTPTLTALADKSNLVVNISSNPSPGARITDDNTGKQVKTITIDDFVKENSIPRINFIKMDIEGAEVPALSGAKETISKFKPKLAICVYHKWDDLYVIPKLISEIRPDYQFFLDCTTGFGGEAVLYCR